MHIVLSCFGTSGDVHPFIVIGRALNARGHDVALVAAEPFRARVEAAGLDFISDCSQAQFDALFEQPEVWDSKGGLVMFKHIGELCAQRYAVLAKLVRPGETRLVASTFALPARLVQERLGVDLATVHLSPFCICSSQKPPAWGSWRGREWLPRWLVATLRAAVERKLFDPAILPGLNALRAELGLPPTQAVFSRWLHSPQRVICAFPRWMAEPAADWPANLLMSTFPRSVARLDEHLDGDLVRFLDGGTPPIVFTPGSTMWHGGRFFAKALEACAALRRRAVFVTPRRDQLPAALPPFAHHVAYAPFDLLAPRAAVFVHHGGIGTCAHALATGTPQMVTPFMGDQHDNGARLEALGVGRVVKPDASARAWVRALSRLLEDPSVAQACAGVAATMAQEQPAGPQIAQWIESPGAPPPPARSPADAQGRLALEVDHG